MPPLARTIPVVALLTAGLGACGLGGGHAPERDLVTFFIG